MNIRERLYHLYQPDQRMGDALLNPLRWSERHWILLAQGVQAYNPCQFLAAAVRVALLIVPTLVAAIFAMMGMTLKACSNPLPIVAQPSQMPDEEVYHRLESASSAEPLLVPPVPIHSLLVPPVPIHSLYKDLFVYVATFLSEQDQLAFAKTSVKCYQNIDSLVLWKERLASLRIWGATNQEFTYDRKKKQWVSNLIGWEKVSPLKQLRTYYKLKFLKGGFLDYIARLMPGGPVAFSQIPQAKYVLNASALLPREMTTSLLRGVEILGRRFFALKLLDRSSLCEKMLVFIKQGIEWECEWEYGKLSSSEQNTLNYLLALMHSEDLTQRKEFSSPPYNSNVELFTPLNV